MRKALGAVFLTAIGAFALAAVASVWLAQTISRPIDTLSKSLSEMTASRDFEHPVQPTGFSLEVDTLTAAFNTMMQSVSAAEAETEEAYVGAIRALALALDARDPYTAGHSERVSALSVAIGRQMRLAADQLEILRLGALLHDIGKIGISDAVLRKPGPLTREEFAVVEQHPLVGARILRSVHFLAPHLAIVELHHERPDGQGYPHRLRGNEIPLLARIVRVADAFDAMTSARAYRPAHGRAEAMRELWRCAGPQFDAEWSTPCRWPCQPSRWHRTATCARTPQWCCLVSPSSPAEHAEPISSRSSRELECSSRRNTKSFVAQRGPPCSRHSSRTSALRFGSSGKARSSLSRPPSPSPSGLAQHDHLLGRQRPPAATPAGAGGAGLAGRPRADAARRGLRHGLSSVLPLGARARDDARRRLCDSPRADGDEPWGA